MKKDLPELISGAVIAAFGLYVTYAATRLEYRSEFGPGPGFFPLWLGIGIFLLAAGLVVKAAVGSTLERRQRAAGLGRAGAAWLGFLLTIALVPRLGFTISFALLSAFLVFFLERQPVLFSLAVSTGLAAAFYLVFQVALGLDLPSDPWGF